MADDLYSALIEGVPTQSQRQAALARALRQQNLLGELGAFSGDRVMGPAGERLAASSEQGAEDLASQRERQQALGLEQSRYNTEAQQGQERLNQEMEIARMNDARARDLAKLLAQNRADVAGIRANASANNQKLPASTIKELEQDRDTMAGIQEALGAYQSGFGHTIGPGGRSLENLLAQKGMGSEGMKAAQNWWANYGRQFTLPGMHAQFGARLTPQEMARWEQYHIDPNMTDDQIRQNLGQIYQEYQNMVGRRVSSLSAGGYNPGYLNSIISSKVGTTQAPTPGQKYLQMVRMGRQSQPQQTQPQQPQGTLLQQALMSNPNSPLNPMQGLFSGLGGIGGP